MDTNELLENRGSIYGDVKNNMNCANDFIDVWNNYMAKYGPTFMTKYNEIAYVGCMTMVFHKLARMCTGVQFHLDNFEDIKGYIELAKKIVIEDTGGNVK